jgi:hypothetical protein
MPPTSPPACMLGNLCTSVTVDHDPTDLLTNTTLWAGTSITGPIYTIIDLGVSVHVMEGEIVTRVI